VERKPKSPSFPKVTEGGGGRRPLLEGVFLKKETSEGGDSLKTRKFPSVLETSARTRKRANHAMKGKPSTRGG